MNCMYELYMRNQGAGGNDKCMIKYVYDLNFCWIFSEKKTKIKTKALYIVFAFY